jgi:hypothetical protein
MTPPRLALIDTKVYTARCGMSRIEKWLNTDLILSQFNGKYSYKAYREKVQKYSEEDAKIFENLRHGIVFGTGRYLNKITEKYLKKESDEELPQLNRIIKV